MSARAWRLGTALAVGLLAFIVVACASVVLGSSSGSQRPTASLICQTDPVTLGWKSVYGPAGDVRLGGIEVRGIGEDCDGQGVLIAVFDSGAQQVGLFRATLRAGSVTADEYFADGWHVAADGGGPLAAQASFAQFVFGGPWRPSDV